MKAVIVGCGRVGAGLADQLDRSGHQVVILDVSSAAFERLPSTFGGSAIRGDGTDEDVLRRAGAEGADIFLALTEGDNRNVMAAQLAVEAFHVGTTIAKINDPVRADAYTHLGIASLCRTNLMQDAVLSFLSFPVQARPGIAQPTRPHHPDGEETGPLGGAGGSSAGAGGDPRVASSSDVAPAGPGPASIPAERTEA
jgi:trk system potassium uptake protein TrkA